MKLFELGVIILLIYIPILGIVSRICTCKERIAEAQFGKKEEKKERIQTGFTGKN